MITMLGVATLIWTTRYKVSKAVLYTSLLLYYVLSAYIIVGLLENLMRLLSAPGFKEVHL